MSGEGSIQRHMVRPVGEGWECVDCKQKFSAWPPDREPCAEGARDRVIERLDDNEVEMRTRILEQQTGAATPWSAWSRYATQHGTGLTGVADEAVAAAVRHTILSGYIAMTSVSRVIETAEGQPVRTIEYEFRTVGDGRIFDRTRARQADDENDESGWKETDWPVDELGPHEPTGIDAHERWEGIDI